MITDDPHRSFIDVTQSLAADSGPDGMSIRDVLDRMDERAFGLAILIMSIPCLVPGLYGPPQILALPIILFAAQMLIGRKEPWLPKGLLERRVPKSWLDGMATFADKRLRWLERIARPRLTFLTVGLAKSFAALCMILATITIALPMTNTVPSVALALLSIGVMTRDGVLTIAGAIVALAWVGLLVAVIVGLFFGAGFAAEWAQANLSWLRDFLSGGS
jgi:hypothetical protein